MNELHMKIINDSKFLKNSMELDRMFLMMLSQNHIFIISMNHL